MAEGAKESSVLSFLISALIPFMRVLHSGPKHLPKAPPPNTITLDIMILTYEFGGWDTNIQTIATIISISISKSLRLKEAN